MAHGTRIGGVNKGVTAGFTRINGVNKKVKKGLTMVSGVQKNIEFGVAPEGSTLNECSWQNISDISTAGMASNYWDIGDTKTITINGKAGATTFSNLSVAVFVIGFDHNSAKEGANLTHFQIGKISGKDVCLCDSSYNSQQTASGKFTMNTSSTNSGGWNNSHMRKTVLGSDSTPASPTANTLMACLPSDLRVVMKPITKYTDNTGGGKDTASFVTATTEYLCLLAEYEIHGKRTYANSAEQKSQSQYQYYKAGNSKVKYKHNATTTAVRQWVRSVDAKASGAFCVVGSDGNPEGFVGYAKTSFGIAPCFAA